MKIFGRNIPIFWSLILWAVIWELVGRTGLFDIFPPLTEVVKAGAEMIPTDKFQDAIVLTFRNYMTGMVLSRSGRHSVRRP